MPGKYIDDEIVRVRKELDDLEAITNGSRGVRDFTTIIRGAQDV